MKKEKQKTAVEFLIEQLDNNLDINHSWRTRQYIEQAKEMEAKQKNHFVELSKWIIENKRSVFDNADISIESKRKILNELGYSSGDY
jgi:hypothetical protein